MNGQDNMQGCRLRCWMAAGGIGLLAFLILLAIAGKGFIASVLLGIILGAVLGPIFIWLFCAEVPQPRSPSKTSGAGTAAAGAMSSGDVAARPAPTGGTVIATPAPDAETAGLEQPDAGQDDAAKEAAGQDDSDKEASAAPAGDAPGAEGSDAGVDDALAKSDRTGQGDAEDAAADEDPDSAKDGQSGSLMKPSAALAGQAELASRKGEWKYDAGADTAAAQDTGEAKDTPASETVADETVADETSGDADVWAGTAAAEDAGSAKDDTAAEDAKPGEGDTAGDSDTASSGDAREPVAPMSPEGLDEPRPGGPDNLKEIKGIGPKLEEVLNTFGFYHFDQIAAWTEAEVAWADENLVGVRGRASRDDWVGQAKTLAAGGETEFSQRVDKGKVY